jgi:hypothetical protein
MEERTPAQNIPAAERARLEFLYALKAGHYTEGRFVSPDKFFAR